MVKRRGGFGLLDEAPHAILILGEFGRQQLERDLAVEPCIFGQVNLAHPARAEFGDNAVMRQIGVCRKAHSNLFSNSIFARSSCSARLSSASVGRYSLYLEAKIWRLSASSV